MVIDGVGIVPEGATPTGYATAEPGSEHLLPSTDMGTSPAPAMAEVVGTEADAEAAPGLSAEQLARLRAVLVAAHPDAVPELIAGGTFEALVGSVEGARTAFTRVRDEAARGLAAGVPRGGGTREIDPTVFAGLSPEGKIAVGLSRK